MKQNKFCDEDPRIIGQFEPLIIIETSEKFRKIIEVFHLSDSHRAPEKVAVRKNEGFPKKCLNWNKSILKVKLSKPRLTMIA